jgi:hypothetical protein
MKLTPYYKLKTGFAYRSNKFKALTRSATKPFGGTLIQPSSVKPPLQEKKFWKELLASWRNGLKLIGL